MFYTNKHINNLKELLYKKGRYYDNQYFYDEDENICLLLMIRRRDHKVTQTIFNYNKFKKVSQYSWYPHHDKNKPDYMIYVLNATDNLRLHRILISIRENEVVDHIDHNPLNNLKSNIRSCTVRENNRNLSLSRRNTSGYKNIRFVENRDYYIVEISTCDGRKTKTFPIKKYGNDALNKAIAWRDTYSVKFNDYS